MAEERGLVTYQSRDGQQIKLSFDVVRKYLVSGHPEMVTDQEIVLYMGMAKARGLNPFKRDCYLIKYTANDPAATIVSIDYFRSRARAQEDCVGWKAGILVADKENHIEYREGSFLMDEERLVGGWFKARPKYWTEDYTWTVSLKPYIKTTREGKPTQFWQSDKQAYMIQKIAESQGLRRLWPDEFQGLFIEDDHQPIDITQASDTPIKVPQPVREQLSEDNQTQGNMDSQGEGGSRSQDSQVASGLVERKQEVPPKVHEPSQVGDQGENKVNPPAEEGAQETVEQTALRTIAGYTKETFPKPNVLNPWMRNQPIGVQNKITSAYNAKAKELGF
jgi:phage recombination protein Bet